jgi:hypothetical protein
MSFSINFLAQKERCALPAAKTLYKGLPDPLQTRHGRHTAMIDMSFPLQKFLFQGLA